MGYDWVIGIEIRAIIKKSTCGLGSGETSIGLFRSVPWECGGAGMGLGVWSLNGSGLGRGRLGYCVGIRTLVLWVPAAVSAGLSTTNLHFTLLLALRLWLYSPTPGHFVWLDFIGFNCLKLWYLAFFSSTIPFFTYGL